MTSVTHPLRIDSVPVPGSKGTIGMTLCPGKVQTSAVSGEWARDLGVDLEAIRAWGATVLVTLMEAHELKRCRVEDLPGRIPPGMSHFTLPIIDGWVPDSEWENQWEAVGPQVRNVLSEGGKVVIHCRGGLGRTGLLAALLLVEFGVEAGNAIQQVRTARPGAIENLAQERFVTDTESRAKARKR